MMKKGCTMKKILTAGTALIMGASLLMPYVSAEDGETVAINEENFPDENFREYVKNFDMDGNGAFSQTELDAVTEIDCSFYEIYSLAGVENFIELKRLYCGGNNLSELDVSGLTNLEELCCEYNNLSELDVSGLTNLTYLSCGGNNLSELEISGLTILWYLSCGENNLSGLDVSGLTNLTGLYCEGNNLSGLDVSGLTNLTSLDCRENNLSELDVSELTNLEGLYCGENNLSELEVSGLTNLKELDCRENNLSKLEVSGLTNLEYLSCYGNNLSELDVSDMTNLWHLDCGGNNLSELEVSGLTNLENLYCGGNNLSELDLSSLTYLSSLDCTYNNLSELDVSKNLNLTQIYCGENFFADVDVSMLEKLEIFENEQCRRAVSLQITSLPDSLKCSEGDSYEDIDYTGLEITIRYNTGEAAVWEYAGSLTGYVDPRDISVTGPESISEEDKTITVTYDKLKVSFDMEVTDPSEWLMQELTDADEGTVLSIVQADLGGTPVVTQDVLKIIQDKNITVDIACDNGITWTINGAEISAGGIGDTDISVTRTGADSGNIPSDTITSLAGTRDAEQLIFGQDGAFDFTGHLTFGMTSGITGNKAVLLQPSSADGSLTLMDSALIVDNNITFSVSQGEDSAVIYGTNGDTNGDGEVTIKDTMQMLQHVSARTAMNEVQKGFADVDVNGTVNIQDLMRELYHVSGRNSTL